MNDKEQIAIKLSSSEALVLFELLSRFSNEDKLELVDQAEERVLWSICARLEGVLAEPFAENYNELLTEAREAVRDKINE